MNQSKTYHIEQHVEEEDQHDKIDQDIEDKKIKATTFIYEEIILNSSQVKDL